MTTNLVSWHRNDILQFWRSEGQNPFLWANVLTWAGLVLPGASRGICSHAFLNSWRSLSIVLWSLLHIINLLLSSCLLSAKSLSLLKVKFTDSGDWDGNLWGPLFSPPPSLRIQILWSSPDPSHQGSCHQPCISTPLWYHFISSPHKICSMSQIFFLLEQCCHSTFHTILKS